MLRGRALSSVDVSTSDMRKESLAHRRGNVFGVKDTDGNNDNTMLTRRLYFKVDYAESGVLHGDEEEISAYTLTFIP